MKNEVITENNILIAEFMNYEKQTWSYNDAVAYYTPFKENSLFSDKLKFHTDWNWLMQVVEKIFNTCEITPDELDYEWGILFKQIHNSFYYPKIEAVYNACIEFIKWYNENKI